MALGLLFLFIIYFAVFTLFAAALILLVTGFILFLSNRSKVWCWVLIVVGGICFIISGPWIVLLAKGIFGF